MDCDCRTSSANDSQRRQYSSLGREVGEMLLAQGLTVSSAESCTGGTIASMLAQIAGSSAYYKGSVVSYAVSVKEQVLGVKIGPDGVVSEDTARQMALGVARVCDTDCAVSTTGIAGPGGAEPGKPVGTVCMAVCYRYPSVSQKGDGDSNQECVETHECVRTRTYHFEGDREAVILQSADAALKFLKEILTEI